MKLFILNGDCTQCKQHNAFFIRNIPRKELFISYALCSDSHCMHYSMKWVQNTPALIS